MADINRALKQFIDQQRRNKAAEEQVRQARNDQDRTAVLQNVGKDLAESLKPVLPELVKSSQITKEMIREALVEAIQINMPEVSMPEISMPDIAIDTKNLKNVINKAISNISIPPPVVNVPETIFPDRFGVDIDQFDNENPLPVIMMDTKGRPFQFPVGSSGGKADFFTIKDIKGSTASIIDQIDGALKVTGDLSATLALDYGEGEIGDNTARIAFATDAIASVNIVGGSSSGTEYTDGDTSSTPDGSVIMGDTGEESANIYALALGSGVVGSSVLRVVTAADSVTSVNIVSGSSSGTEYDDGEVDATPTGPTLTFLSQVGEVMNAVSSTHALPITPGTSVVFDVDATGQGDVPITLDGESVTVTASQLDIDDLDPSSDGVRAYQVSGANWSVSVTNTVAVDATGQGDVPITLDGETVTVTGTITSSVAYLTDADGNYRDEIQVQGITNTVAANIVDSVGNAYTTSNPVPIDDAGGSITVDSSALTAIQTAIQIVDDWDGVHGAAVGSDGARILAEARTTNPTAVDNGDNVRLQADDLGRQINRPIAVRDLTRTAYISLSNGTATSLIAGTSGEFHDIIYIMAANQSDAAVTVDFISGTGGSVMFTLQVPAEGTVGIAPPVPLKQNEASQSWVADMSDITGTTVDISAQYSIEV